MMVKKEEQEEKERRGEKLKIGRCERERYLNTNPWVEEEEDYLQYYLTRGAREKTKKKGGRINTCTRGSSREETTRPLK